MERILVIDDNSSDRRLLRDALEHAGHSVEEAAHGWTGLKVLFASRPDIVVLDVLMPEIDGVVFYLQGVAKAGLTGVPQRQGGTGSGAPRRHQGSICGTAPPPP